MGIFTAIKEESKVDESKVANKAIIAVIHGEGVCLYKEIASWFDDSFGAGESEPFRIDEGVSYSVPPGVWVVDLVFEDDGPGDWPGTREWMLCLENHRPPTQEEWEAFPGWLLDLGRTARGFDAVCPHVQVLEGCKRVPSSA
jgi:hypothetical protein